jgi:uncharacterized protein (TIGR02757 family)
MTLNMFSQDLINTPVPTFNLLSDPLQFPHRFHHALDAECVAFISAMAAYGQRPLILALLETLIAPMGKNPVDWLMHFQTPTRLASHLNQHWPDFRYRFNTRQDFVWLFQRLQHIYQTYGSLEKLLLAHWHSHYQTWLANWMTALIGDQPPQHSGLRYLLAHPARQGSCKRLHLFLRWMVRGPDGVDLGLWTNSITPNQLLMPLDTHVAKAGRHLGLITRKSNDWKTVEQLTAALKAYCPHDPVSLDVYLFQLGQTLL